MLHDRTLTGRAEVERLLFHWPAVIRAAQEDWAKTFAQSIALQSRRRGWNPSAKQLGIMRRMVAELFQRAAEDDGALIE